MHYKLTTITATLVRSGVYTYLNEYCSGWFALLLIQVCKSYTSINRSQHETIETKSRTK
jgi:hypothetical protein